MKVALLGSPGAGKSAVARKLTTRLGKEWRVIDGYVDKLTTRTGHPFGAIFDRSAFRRNVQVIGERWTLEDAAQHKGLNTITCGSIFETIVYAAAQGMPIQRLGSEQLMLEEIEIAKQMMSTFGLLASMEFDYDALFYLERKSNTDTWDRVVDAKLPEVLDGQFKQALVLRGTDKEKVQTAYDIIDTIQNALAKNDQQAVRRGTEGGAREESGSEHVSDMPPAED